MIAIERQKAYSFALANYKPVDPNAQNNSSIVWGADKNASWGDVPKEKNDILGEFFNSSRDSGSGAEFAIKDEIFNSFEIVKDKPAEHKKPKAEETDVFASFGV